MKLKYFSVASLSHCFIAKSDSLSFKERVGLFYFLFLILNFLFISRAHALESHTYYYHTDHLGSVVAVTNETGNLVKESRYLPYGSPAIEPSFAEASAGKATERGYTGQRKDSSTTLNYYNARYYDPTLARFISADSTNDQQNRYNYVGGNPVMKNDPGGNDDIPWREELYQRKERETFNILVLIFPQQDKHFDNKLREEIITSDSTEKDITHIKGGAQMMENALDINYNLNFQTISGNIPYWTTSERTSSGFHFANYSNGGMSDTYDFNYQWLYNSYNLSSNNYNQIWLMAGNQGRMGENVYIGDMDIPVLGFNRDACDGCLEHTLGHNYEAIMALKPNSPFKEKFDEMTNFTQSRPFFSELTPYDRQPSKTSTFRYHSDFIGSVHRPFNSFREYQYDSKAVFDLKGFSPHNSDLWGGTHRGYMNFWFTQLGKNKDMTEFYHNRN